MTRDPWEEVEREAWIGPDQLPEAQTAATCLWVALIGAELLAFLCGVAIGFAWGRIS